MDRGEKLAWALSGACCSPVGFSHCDHFRIWTRDQSCEERGFELDSLRAFGRGKPSQLANNSWAPSTRAQTLRLLACITMTTACLANASSLALHPLMLTSAERALDGKVLGS